MPRIGATPAPTCLNRPVQRKPVKPIFHFLPAFYGALPQ